MGDPVATAAAVADEILAADAVAVAIAVVKDVMEGFAKGELGVVTKTPLPAEEADAAAKVVEDATTAAIEEV